MAFSSLTIALPKVARSGGDDLLRAGTKAVAGSADDIARRVSGLVSQNLDPDAILEAKQISDYICKNVGGNGAFRELADLILSSKKNHL